MSSVCIVHRNVDGATSIGQVARWAAQTALDAGWDVTLVAEHVDPALQGHVEVLPLWTPPRLHVVQWHAAWATVAWSLRGRSFDVIHTHQPQVAGLGNLLQLHMIVRDALAGRTRPASVKARVYNSQYGIVAASEAIALRRLPSRVLLAPVSSYLLKRYEDAFGRRERTVVLEPPLPSAVPVPVRNGPGLVLGYLGGDDVRKGTARLLEGLAAAEDVHLRWGGAGSLDCPAPGVPNLTRLGYVDDLDAFFSSIDVLCVPSTFEPYGLVVTEAMTHGVPVLVSEDVGAADFALTAGGAETWRNGEPLTAALARLQLADMRTRLAALDVPSAQATQRQQLLSAYDLAAEHPVKRG